MLMCVGGYKENTLCLFDDTHRWRNGSQIKCTECKKLSQLESKRRHDKKRYKEDLNYRIRSNLRARLRTAFKRKVKTASAIKDLDCTYDEFKSYIESMFYFHPVTGERMTWDNYGQYGWHLDHIESLVQFDLTIPEQAKLACHFTNIQPMWYDENLRKARNKGKNVKLS